MIDFIQLGALERETTRSYIWSLDQIEFFSIRYASKSNKFEAYFEHAREGLILMINFRKNVETRRFLLQWLSKGETLNHLFFHCRFTYLTHLLCALWLGERALSIHDEALHSNLKESPCS